MGGRGTYAIGNMVKYTYETVYKINGIKVLEKINKNDSRNLPEESHYSKAYLQMNKDGSFSKYREYGDDHLPIFEIEFGTHRGHKFYTIMNILMELDKMQKILTIIQTYIKNMKFTLEE